MDRDAVLGQMRAYFEAKQPPDVLADFARQSPRALLPDSMDIVDFILHLEETLGCEIDVSEIGESLVRMNFGELAGELAGRC